VRANAVRRAKDDPHIAHGHLIALRMGLVLEVPNLLQLAPSSFASLPRSIFMGIIQVRRG
jgi:hypothetical protein